MDRRWAATVSVHDTVFANVTLGDENLTETDVRAALEVAGAWEFASALPDGMMTTVGERGSQLSGGQRQRVGVVDEPEPRLASDAARLWGSASSR